MNEKAPHQPHSADRSASKKAAHDVELNSEGSAAARSAEETLPDPVTPELQPGDNALASHALSYQPDQTVARTPMMSSAATVAEREGAETEALFLTPMASPAGTPAETVVSSPVARPDAEGTPSPVEPRLVSANGSRSSGGGASAAAGPGESERVPAHGPGTPSGGSASLGAHSPLGGGSAPLTGTVGAHMPAAASPAVSAPLAAVAEGGMSEGLGSSDMPLDRAPESAHSSSAVSSGHMRHGDRAWPSEAGRPLSGEAWAAERGWPATSPAAAGASQSEVDEGVWADPLSGGLSQHSSAHLAEPVPPGMSARTDDTSFADPLPPGDSGALSGRPSSAAGARPPLAPSTWELDGGAVNPPMQSVSPDILAGGNERVSRSTGESLVMGDLIGDADVDTEETRALRLQMGASLLSRPTGDTMSGPLGHSFAGATPSPAHTWQSGFLALFGVWFWSCIPQVDHSGVAQCKRKNWCRHTAPCGYTHRSPAAQQHNHGHAAAHSRAANQRDVGVRSSNARAVHV